MKSKLSIVLLSATLLVGCTTVKIPDLVDLPGFRDAAQTSGEYPDPSDAPAAPTGLRSSADWDKAAKAIIARRDGFVVPKGGDDLTDEQIKQNVNALKSKVREYKLDDPIEY